MRVDTVSESTVALVVWTRDAGGIVGGVDLGPASAGIVVIGEGVVADSRQALWTQSICRGAIGGVVHEPLLGVTVLCAGISADQRGGRVGPRCATCVVAEGSELTTEDRLHPLQCGIEEASLVALKTGVQLLVPELISFVEICVECRVEGRDI